MAQSPPPSDRTPDTDELDQIVLDDDFVNSAKVKEKSHRRRSLGRINPRRLVRKPTNVFKKQLPLPVIALCLAAIVGILGYAKFIAPQQRDSGIDLLAEQMSQGPTSSTSTTITLSDRNYKPGDCVSWNQDSGGSGERITHVRPCSEPHLFEYVDTYMLTNSPGYPTDAEWDTIFERDCKPRAETYLGYKLDPSGRFNAGAIRPTEQGWAQGQREIQCGIQVRSDQFNYDPERLDEFTGVVKGQTQTPHVPVGTCVKTTADKSGSVDCAQPHNFEITGQVELKSDATFPTSVAAWDRLVGGACESKARAYAGSLSTGVQAGWFEIERGSWDAGRRTVDCTVARYNGEEPIERTGTLRRALQT